MGGPLHGIGTELVASGIEIVVPVFICGAGAVEYPWLPGRRELQLHFVNLFPKPNTAPVGAIFTSGSAIKIGAIGGDALFNGFVVFIGQMHATRSIDLNASATGFVLRVDGNRSLNLQR